MIREIVAYHEAGHAVMKHILGQPISRASIVGTTSGVGGVVLGKEYEAQSEKLLRDRYHLVERLAKKLLENEIMNGNEIDELLS